MGRIHEEGLKPDDYDARDYQRRSGTGPISRHWPISYGLGMYRAPGWAARSDGEGEKIGAPGFEPGTSCSQSRQQASASVSPHVESTTSSSRPSASVRSDAPCWHKFWHRPRPRIGSDLRSEHEPHFSSQPSRSGLQGALRPARGAPLSVPQRGPGDTPREPRLATTRSPRASGRRGFDGDKQADFRQEWTYRRSFDPATFDTPSCSGREISEQRITLSPGQP